MFLNIRSGWGKSRLGQNAWINEVHLTGWRDAGKEKGTTLLLTRPFPGHSTGDLRNKLLAHPYVLLDHAFGAL